MADVGITFGGDSADARRAAEQIIRELEKVSRQALQTSAVMRTALGGVSKDFGGMTRASVTNRKELERNRTEVDRNTNSFSKFSRQIIVANQALSLMGKTIAVLKFPAMIVAVGYAVQAINALAAGALALVGALGSLAGLAGAIPGAIITLGTAALTAKLAFNGLKEALNGNEEAFKKLTPEAQQFVKVLNGIKPIIKDFRQSAQQGLFPGLTEGLNSIFNERNVAVISNGLKLMGKAMGDSFAELGKLIGTSGFAKDLDFLLKSAARNFRILGGAAVDIVDAFRNIAVAAQPLVNYITSLISRFGEWLRQATEAGRASGALAGFFDQTKQTLQELGHILGPVGKALVNIFKIAAPYGHQLLKLLGGAADQLQRVTESASGKNAIKKYFADAMPVLIEMGRLVRDVVGAFLKIGATPELTNLIKRLRLELLPILVGIMDSAMRGFAPALVDAAIALAKLVAVVAGASGPLTQFVKFLGGIFKFATWIIQNVPYATQILAALFGIMAVNKVIPITKGIQYLVRQYQLLAIAELEAGTASTVMSRLFAVSVKAMKAALVSTGIGALLLGIGLAAEYIITHWEEVKQWFTDFFDWLKANALDAALKILEPFSHLPGAMGQWARDAKDAVNAELASMNAPAAIAGAGTGDAWGKAYYENVMKWVGETGTAVISGTAGQPGRGQPIFTQAGRGTGVQKILAFAQQYGVGSGITYPQSGAGHGSGITLTPKVGIEAGYDCSAFVGSALLAAGIRVPWNAAAQWNSAPIKGRPGGEQPGDAVFFGNPPHHVGLYVGGGYFVEYFSHGKPAARSVLKNRRDYIGWGRWIKVSKQTSNVAATQLGGAGAFAAPETTITTPSASAIVPTTPTFTGGTTTTTKPKIADVKAVRADVADFAKGVRRVLDPRIRKELAGDIQEVRKLLSGPVTKSEMEKAKKLFDQMKALYADGINLNPIVQKLNYFDSHMGRFASLPKTADAIRQGIRRTRALIAKFAKKGSEGGVLITDEEQAQIEKSFHRVETSVKKGLQQKAIQDAIRKFAASMKNLWPDVQKALAPPLTADELSQRINDLIQKAKTALPNQAKGLLARARELRQQLVETLTTNIGNAKQRITDALGGIFDNAMEAITSKWQRWLRGQEAAIAAAFGVIRGQTAASRKLQEFRDAREEANIKKAVLAANKELSASEMELMTLRQQGADPEAIKQAEERVQAARDAIAEQQLDAQDRTLQKEADAQEQAYQDALEAARQHADDMAEIERNKFAERYRMIQQAYADETITAEEAQAQILALLGDYGIETTEAMGATAVFTKALEELAKSIINLATVLKSARELSTPSSGGDNKPGGGDNKPSGGGNKPQSTFSGGGGGAFKVYQTGGLVTRSSGPSIGRDHVLVGASPGEVILNAAQQANIMAGMRGGSPIVVQINRPLLLGRSLAVADEIAGAVAPAINRRIGYRY